MYPTLEDRCDSRILGQAGGNVAQQWRVGVAIGGPNRRFEQRPFALVKPSADRRAEVHRVGGRRPDASFIVAVRRP